MSGDNTKHVQINLSHAYQHEFDEMSAAFGNLIHTVGPLIATCIPSLEDLKKYLQRCFRELRPQLSIAESFDDVMDVVQDKCTITNIACLEVIVNRYNIEEAKVHIAAYKAKVDDFCKMIKITICQNKDFMTSPSTLKCETIEFVLEEERSEHALSEIRHLLFKAFEDIADRVVVKEVKEGNIMIVVSIVLMYLSGS